jgi:hypothetical protein
MGQNDSIGEALMRSAFPERKRIATNASKAETQRAYLEAEARYHEAFAMAWDFFLTSKGYSQKEIDRDRRSQTLQVKYGTEFVSQVQSSQAPMFQLLRFAMSERDELRERS